MFVALSTGILTALTATVMPQIEPAFAETDDCEDNDDFNCNESNERSVTQDNHCNSKKKFGDGNNNGNSGGSLDFSCSNSIVGPTTGDVIGGP